MTPDPGDVPPLAIRPYGDAGLFVEVSSADAEVRWSLVQDLGAALLADPPTGLTDVVAAFDTVFVAFEPLATDHDELARTIVARSGRRADRAEPREFVVPVCYGGELGPDLEEVAVELGLEPPEVVALHTGAPWTVRFRGSPAGAPALDGPQLPGTVSRRPSPRTRVLPGSVGLSGNQCLIYPVASPGGWSLIGRTPLRLADPARDGLVPYQPGDRMRFVAIEEPEWSALEGRDLA